MSFARFCTQCGEPFARPAGPCAKCGAGAKRTCTACAAENDGDSRFCGSCGTPIGGHSIAVEEAGAEVTVVCAGDSLPAEAMPLLADVVSRYDGTIARSNGDALIALFGNDPERAVRAACDMQRVIHYAFDFPMRIGVHTGEANIAAELQAAADPGSVLVSETTYERTTAYLRYEPVEALRAYRVQESAPERGIPGVYLPLVGRDVPLAAMHEAYRAEGMQTVCVSGEAGVGKTRLVNELLAAIPDARVVTARCVALTRTRALSLASDLIRTLLGVDASDPAQAQLDAIRLFVRTHDLADDPPTAFLAAMLGVAGEDPDLNDSLRQFDEEMLKEQTHAAARRVLLAAARAQRLIVVLDDLHWIDAASRDLLAYFAQSAPEEQLLVILITRPRERDTILRPLLEAAMGTRRFTDVSLEPLGGNEARLLVRTLIPADTPQANDVRQKIIASAEGNPFSVEEIVRLLVDRGVLTGPPGEWDVTEEAERVLHDSPSTVRGLVLTRFDSLEPRMRRALQKASVLGRPFPVRLLQQIVGDRGIDVPKALEKLQQCDFLCEEALGLEKGYAFRHVLIEEAIQSTLLRRDRRALHRQVATAIEEGGQWSTSDRTEMLAYHWSESAEPQRAVPYLIAAAEYAARKHANEIAVDHCRKVLQILSGGEAGDERALRAQLILGRALKFLGRLPEAETTLNVASQALYTRLGIEDASPSLVTLYIEVLRELGDVKAREGALDEAFARVEEAHLALASFGVEEGARGLRESLLERMAWVRFRQGRLDEAIRRADEVLREAEAQPDADPTLLASLYGILGGVLRQYGKLDAAAGYTRKSLALHQRLGYLFGKANAQTNLGILYYALGKWHDAADCFERSDWIRRETGCMVMRGANLQNLALLRLSMGEHGQAREALQSSLRIARQLGDEREAAHALMGLAQVAVVEGHFDEATSLLEQLPSFDRVLGDDDRLQIQWISALVEANRSIRNAIAMVEEGCRIARECGLAESESDCARVLGTLYARSGNPAAAEPALRQSLEVARKVADPYRGALAMLELGGLAPRRREGQELVEEAARVFMQLGAAHDAQRATALLQSFESASA